MKDIINFIQEGLRINKDTKVSKILSYKEIITTLEKNFKKETKLDLNYIDFNVVKDKDKKEEWLQLSSGPYKTEERVNTIKEYIENQFKNMNIKDYKINYNIYKWAMIINVYINENIKNDYS